MYERVAYKYPLFEWKPLLLVGMGHKLWLISVAEHNETESVRITKKQPKENKLCALAARLLFFGERNIS